MGTMTVFAEAEAGGELYITDVEYAKDSKIATGDTAEVDYARKSHYLGPRFEDLDDVRVVSKCTDGV
jgi:hypothetical protein